MIATGKKPDGTDVKAADFGYPLPPTDFSWQIDLRVSTTAPGPGIDGPQWVLEYWSQLNNVFNFVRVEDIAYDKRARMGNVVYIVDSGRGRRADQSLDTPPFRSTNGRIWKMVLDPSDPTKVTLDDGVRRGRRQPRQDARRDPPAGQPRVHADGTARHRGPRARASSSWPPTNRCRTRRRRGSGGCRSRARPRSS